MVKLVLLLPLSWRSEQTCWSVGFSGFLHQNNFSPNFESSSFIGENYVMDTQNYRDFSYA
jgi:hypothetical protein